MTSQTVNVREGNLNFDLKVADELKEIYADGVSLTMLGVPLSKIVFHTVDNSVDPQNGTPEQRRAIFRLVMTTPTLIEFCTNVLKAQAESAQAAKDAARKQLALFEASVDELAKISR